MADLSVERTARKRHTCQDCRQPIEPGQRYVDVAITPEGELGFEGWYRAKAHRPYDCIWYAEEARQLAEQEAGK